uniref:WD_REPEATS_REGION domain-containing protein n=1 Tax=Macrostomum lignano TaxID=282301 RepID=A0A1I8IH63_9PLAT
RKPAMQQQQPDTDDLAEEANGDEFDYEDLEIVDIGEGENDGCLGDDSFESDESEGAEPVPVRQPLEVARDDSVATLSGHASSVFCLAASPDGRLLASGGEDDRALVWRVGADGPHAAATAVDAKLVNVWETSQFGQEVSANPANSSSSAEAQPMWSGEAAELRWGCWHPLVASALLVGTGDGSCWLWQIPSGQCKVIAGGQVDSETTCGLVLPNDPGHALAAHDNGRVRLLDLRAGQAVATSTGSLECDSSVLAIDAAPSSGLAACGTETGDVVCFRAAAPRVPLAVCSLPQESLLAAGCLAGFAFVFDLQAAGSLRVRLRCSVGAGVVRVLWLPRPATTGPLRLATADVAGRARIWDGLSGQPLLELL